MLLPILGAVQDQAWSTALAGGVPALAGAAMGWSLSSLQTQSSLGFRGSLEVLPVIPRGRERTEAWQFPEGWRGSCHRESRALHSSPVIFKDDP